jgi:aromatic ring-cleaving dioxygenase
MTLAPVLDLACKSASWSLSFHSKSFITLLKASKAHAFEIFNVIRSNTLRKSTRPHTQNVYQALLRDSKHEHVPLWMDSDASGIGKAPGQHLYKKDHFDHNRFPNSYNLI